MDRSLGTEAGVEENGRAERLDEGPDTSDPAFRSRIKDNQAGVSRTMFKHFDRVSRHVAVDSPSDQFRSGSPEAPAFGTDTPSQLEGLTPQKPLSADRGITQKSGK
ncbi:hypothetical protein A1Q1_05894 [Trichosporon asahii var. asahii CBS 2479]|uniref:Uncharacterized protein n=1 Tax=Trichosporon asahii var. asahii (strain ATCC 90039 / CBS 2479 / JCM 2466 / KCTC 7840 / NBRC 103889/ NCYC 2677 / UAMH 7654) TaxID=1186058 RepID=J4U6G7_TRIAS|nr:hypothetical protein A1Q1_05894 [Trichosporon asahii var. asahii CBS 2479]EJT45745.1 hypothetical protein A1Q1_05894 [Trichosporon asahii var. asahii CBS 2479]